MRPAASNKQSSGLFLFDNARASGQPKNAPKTLLPRHEIDA